MILRALALAAALAVAAALSGCVALDVVRDAGACATHPRDCN